jgi:SAM-dependent methyltransferase
MSWAYRLMYAIGFAPWDRGIPAELEQVVNGPEVLAPGRAFDLGSGLGRKTIFLASNGWEVSGVEMVPRAVATARRRATEQGVRVDFRVGDVTRLETVGLTPGYDLLFDYGCYHGLNERQREQYSAGLSSLAAPSATLLVMGFRNALPPVPKGVSAAELLERFPGWHLVWERPATTTVTAAMRRADAAWFRLSRAG